MVGVHHAYRFAVTIDDRGVAFHNLSHFVDRKLFEEGEYLKIFVYLLELVLQDFECLGFSF